LLLGRGLVAINNEAQCRDRASCRINVKTTTLLLRIAAVISLLLPPVTRWAV
jgi:hypothetical protein